MHGKLFKHISEVTPPLLYVGADAEAFSNGKWYPCEILSVQLDEGKEGRSKVWYWRYNVTIGGVHVCRYDLYNSEVTLAVRLRQLA